MLFQITSNETACVEQLCIIPGKNESQVVKLLNLKQSMQSKSDYPPCSPIILKNNSLYVSAGAQWKQVSGLILHFILHLF